MRVGFVSIGVSGPAKGVVPDFSQRYSKPDSLKGIVLKIKEREENKEFTKDRHIILDYAHRNNTRIS